MFALAHRQFICADTFGNYLEWNRNVAGGIGCDYIFMRNYKLAFICLCSYEQRIIFFKRQQERHATWKKCRRK